MKFDDVKAVLLLAAVAGAGYLAWRTYRTGSGIVESVAQSVEQGKANVSSWWNNNIGQYLDGEGPAVSTKAWLYDDYHYTGVDPATGLLVTDGEWYGDAEARRYEAELLERGTQKPAATSVHGAAFGLYRNPGRRAGASLSDAAANNMRAAYAARDPRRLDL